MDFTFDYTQDMSFGFAPTTQKQPATPMFRPATSNQIAKYLELCTQKHVMPQDTTTWSVEMATAEIGKLINFHELTEDQRALIKAKLDHLHDIGVDVNIPESEINKLTRGRDGTASKLIQQLIEVEQRHLDRAPVSDTQLQTLVSWYYCPDIPFEDFNVPLTVMTDIVYEGIQMKRKLTPIEFAKAIQDNFNFLSAREFINRYRADFHEWKKTRITMQQMRLIREVEARMSDISNPTIVDLAITIEGEPVLIQTPVADREVQWSPTAYVPIGDTELLMYSQEDASRMIAQLESELRDGRLSGFNMEAGAEDRVEAIRTVTADKKLEADVEALNNIVFALMALLGQRDDELEHEEVRLIVERWDTRDGDTQVQQLIQHIADMMTYALEEGFVSEENLGEMVSISPIATAIFEVNW